MLCARTCSKHWTNISEQNKSLFLWRWHGDDGGVGRCWEETNKSINKSPSDIKK